MSRSDAPPPMLMRSMTYSNSNNNLNDDSAASGMSEAAQSELIRQLRQKLIEQQNLVSQMYAAASNANESTVKLQAQLDALRAASSNEVRTAQEALESANQQIRTLSEAKYIKHDQAAGGDGSSSSKVEEAKSNQFSSANSTPTHKSIQPTLALTHTPTTIEAENLILKQQVASFEKQRFESTQQPSKHSPLSSYSSFSVLELQQQNVSLQSRVDELQTQLTVTTNSRLEASHPLVELKIEVNLSDDASPTAAMLSSLRQRCEWLEEALAAKGPTVPTSPRGTGVITPTGTASSVLPLHPTQSEADSLASPTDPLSVLTLQLESLQSKNDVLTDTVAALQALNNQQVVSATEAAEVASGKFDDLHSKYTLLLTEFQSTLQSSELADIEYKSSMSALSAHYEKELEELSEKLIQLQAQIKDQADAAAASALASAQTSASTPAFAQGRTMDEGYVMEIEASPVQSSHARRLASTSLASPSVALLRARCTQLEQEVIYLRDLTLRQDMELKATQMKYVMMETQIGEWMNRATNNNAAMLNTNANMNANVVTSTSSSATASPTLTVRLSPSTLVPSQHNRIEELILSRQASRRNSLNPSVSLLQLQTQIEELQVTHAAQMTKLKQEHKLFIDTLQATHDSDVVEMQREKERENEMTKLQHEQATVDLKKEIERQSQTRLAELQSAHDEKYHSLTARFVKSEQDFIALQGELQTLRTNHSRLQIEFDQVQQECHTLKHASKNSISPTSDQSISSSHSLLLTEYQTLYQSFKKLQQSNEAYLTKLESSKKLLVALNNERKELIEWRTKKREELERVKEEYAKVWNAWKEASSNNGDNRVNSRILTYPSSIRPASPESSSPISPHDAISPPLDPSELGALLSSPRHSSASAAAATSSSPYASISISAFTSPRSSATFKPPLSIMTDANHGAMSPSGR